LRPATVAISVRDLTVAGRIKRMIGRAIAKHRIASGFTQEEVAERLNIGNEAVSRMERGVVMRLVARLLELAETFKPSTATHPTC
jgi:DNA-binding XRE family transcriptional regulator